MFKSIKRYKAKDGKTHINGNQWRQTYRSMFMAYEICYYIVCAWFFYILIFLSCVQNHL